MSTRLFTPLVWVCLLALLPAMPSFADDSEVFSLGEVIVTSEEQVVNLATTVTEVSAEDIKQRGARNLGEALEMLPGVDVQRSNKKNESYVQIRGFGNQDVKILVDGVPVYEQYSRSLDLALLPTSAISKITVTKGASSVLYGANTLGGVINIITKKAGHKPSATATAAWGDYGTEDYSLAVSAPLGKFNYWLGYNYRHTDGWRISSDYDGWDSKEDGGKRDLSDYLQHSFNAKLGFDPDPDTSLYLTYDYHDNEKGLPTKGWFMPHWQQWHLNLIGEKKFNDLVKIKARAYYADHEDTIEFKNGDLSGYDNYSVGGDLQSFLDFGQWSFLKAGFTFLRDNSEQADKDAGGGSWSDAEKFEADTYTFALEDEIKPFDWLALVIGASYDYYDPREAGGQPVPQSSDSFNPQIGAVVTISEMTTLHGSAGKKTRFPHLKELYSDWAGGNPGLDPEETIAYEIGLNHAFSDSVSFSVAAFYNDVKDLIDKIDVVNPGYIDPATYVGDYDNEVFYPDNEEEIGVYVNISDAIIQGIECSLGADITDRLWVGANYTYLHTEDKDTKKELEGRPRHRANLDMRYGFPFGLTTSAQLSYTARQYYRDELGPNFLLVNARVEQRLGELWGVEGSAFVEVSNLTDRDYHEEGRLTPGRNFLAGLNFNY